jgi:hypothetical protein
MILFVASSPTYPSLTVTPENVQNGVSKATAGKVLTGKKINV